MINFVGIGVCVKELCLYRAIPKVAVPLYLTIYSCHQNLKTNIKRNAFVIFKEKQYPYLSHQVLRDFMKGHLTNWQFQ